MRLTVVFAFLISIAGRAQAQDWCPFEVPAPQLGHPCPNLGEDGIWGEGRVRAGRGQPEAVLLYGPSVVNYRKPDFAWDEGDDIERWREIQLDAERQIFLNTLLAMHAACASPASARLYCITLYQAYEAWEIAMESGGQLTSEPRYPWNWREVRDWRYRALMQALWHHRDLPWLTHDQITRILAVVRAGPVGPGYEHRECGAYAPVCEFELPN